jgi:hypothetical protein
MSAKLHTRLLLPSKEFPRMMPQDLKELFVAFNEHGVKYLIVGGYAFGVHAEPRATKDLDVFIATDESNSEAVYRALAVYGTPLDGFSPSDFRDGSGLQIGQPPSRIDILQRISGISFEEAWENRIEGHIDGEVLAQVISRDDLIRKKTSSRKRPGHRGCQGAPRSKRGGDGSGFVSCLSRYQAERREFFGT